MDISIYEVGLRDGLQNETIVIPTKEKIQLADMLARAGLKRIELTSFVSPRWIPQLADHFEIAAKTPRHSDVRYAALVPNQRGLDGAIQAQLPEVAVFLSASESHSLKNINKSIKQALDVISPLVACARQEGMFVRGYISTVFGCPYEGFTDPYVVLDLIEQLANMGVSEISLGDTIGVANPTQVRKLLSQVEKVIPFDSIAMHMHDTRGTALANVLAALDMGVTTFDSAFGGLGGCPYAPGAAGNLATEDLVYMLESMGLKTGVDLQSIVLASEHISKLLGRSLPSKVLQSELAQKVPCQKKTKVG